MYDKIILFDGQCPFCHYWVKVALRYDTKKQLLFAPLQGTVAASLLTHHKKKIEQIHSVMFIDNGKLYDQSDAACSICKYLSFPYSLGKYMIWIPRTIRDFFYNTIAKNRYKWFGKYDSCRLPSTSDLSRFVA